MILPDTIILFIYTVYVKSLMAIVYSEIAIPHAMIQFFTITAIVDTRKTNKKGTRNLCSGNSI